MDIINIIQVIVAVVLIILVLLQDRSAGLSGAFGGGSGNTFHNKRRGFEKTIFNLTVIFLSAFIVLSILNFVL